MKIVKRVDEAREVIGKIKVKGKTVGFVPTMGALHKGHISLVERAKNECDFTVMSIFVNPLQFGPNEDFNKYPRPFEKDALLAKEAGVDLLFAPEVEEMVPGEPLAYVDIEKLSNNLCGLSRPGHFRGVCTIVSKLFNILTPDKAYFGKKDIQQLIIIKKMVYDLNFNVEIIPCPIVRELDGLAMSSRNSYLSESERKDALILSKAIKRGASLYKNGETFADNIIKEIKYMIKEVPTSRIDYVKIVDEKMNDVKIIKDSDILALAVYIGKTRLIDNFIFGEELCF